MKKSKNEKKREVKVIDLQPTKNPTGGLSDIVVVKETDKPTPKLIR